MGNPYPMQFVQVGRDIELRFEEFDAVRKIHMGAEAARPAAAPLSPLGYSVGRWDGKTLVIDTSRINWPYFDRSGAPQTQNVTINEPFFVGHFPGHPIMPGVLIIEAMAQVGGLLIMDSVENPENRVVYFMSLDNVKWRRPVTPGDQILFEVEVIQIRSTTARMRGVATVDGQVVAEAEMMARVVDR